MALIYNASFDSQTRVLSLLDKAGNVISSCEVPRKSNELTLTATVDNSSVKLIKNGALSNTYEVNTGSGWTAYTFGTVIPLNAGQSCKWRCTSRPTTFSDSIYVQFEMTGKIEASNPVTSIIKDDLESTSLEGHEAACYRLFMGCSSLVKAPELPATTLGVTCYYQMFYGCYNLAQAPELPATALARYCYELMFGNCNRLKEVRIKATKTATGALDNWLHNVSATGSFYCYPNATIFPRKSASGIPENWTRWNIADYPN